MCGRSILPDTDGPRFERLNDVCSSLEVTVSTPADDDHPALLLTGVSGPVPVGPGPKRAHSNGAGTRVPTRRVAVGKFSLLVAPLGLLCFCRHRPGRAVASGLCSAPTRAAAGAGAAPLVACPTWAARYRAAPMTETDPRHRVPEPR
jgi:hypothetical protein